MTRTGVLLSAVVVLISLEAGLFAAPTAMADDGFGSGTGVRCVGKGCDLRATSRSGSSRRSNPNRAAPAHQSVGGGGGGVRGGGSRGSRPAGSPTVTSDGWEYDLGNGMGILPTFDGGKKAPKKADKPAGGQQVSVAAVAQQAVERLRLPEPVIRTSPDQDFVQVVNVPTWMWVDKGSWGPVSQTARVPGVTVTATARPRTAVWSMGDGSTVSCAGPGTPYSSKYRPEARSPDCGYTYHRSSLAEPGKAFTVSVRVTWDVEWRGGGQTGAVPGLAVEARRQLVVDEVQAVVVR